MCYSIIRAVCLGWLIGGGLMSAVAHAATEILSLNSTSLKEMTLESIPPWPDDMVLSGTNEHRQKILHEGEFVIALYEAMPATIDVAIPYTYDEYVLVHQHILIIGIRYRHIDSCRHCFIQGNHKLALMKYFLPVFIGSRQHHVVGPGRNTLQCHFFQRR